MLFFHSRREPAKLPFHVDIHCHVVPGVDDGSPDAATSVELVRQMADLGIRRIYASPHVTQGTFENSHSTIDPALAELRAALAAAGIDVPVDNHAEYRIDGLLAERLAAGDIMPLPGGYLLIENSFIQEPWNLDQIIFDLQVKGFTPILAHPERYIYYFARPERYRDLHEKGLLFQINLLSLAGAYTPAETKIARQLMERGLVDFVGTDIHRRSHLQRIREYMASKAAARDMSMLAQLVHNDEIFL